MSRQRAGYSLQELFLLSRSQLTQQRSLALSTLANILSKVGNKNTRSSSSLYVGDAHRKLIFVPAGPWRRLRLCFDRQRLVHSVGRWSGLPAALCVGRRRGGSDVSGGARS